MAYSDVRSQYKPIRPAFLGALGTLAVLFVLGLAGVLVRRNILFMLMSLEVMMNAAALAFVVAGARWGQPDGQVDRKSVV